MPVTNKEIARNFSEGNFPFCYEHFANNIAWKLVGNEPLTGKENVIAYCEKMMVEIASSKLNNTNIIEGNGSIAIEGYCNYTQPDNTPAQLFYCDVFRFEDDKIASITSYCIEKKGK